MLEAGGWRLEAEAGGEAAEAVGEAAGGVESRLEREDIAFRFHSRSQAGAWERASHP